MGIQDTGKLSEKRIGYLEWQDYFMAVAFLSAQRSKDPRTQVGACIVNKENKIVGIGYNGMPIGCSDDVMPWRRAQSDSSEEWLDSKAPYVCHAELNAVLNKNLVNIKGCSIYVTLFPCNACAQIIIQSGISEVVYFSDKKHNQKEFRASRHLLNTAGVTYRQYKPCQKKVTIDFDSIEKTPGDISLYPVVNHSGSDSEHTSVNNNNSSGIKSMRLENHAEQQQLQNADQQEAQDPLQQVLQLVPSATTQLNNTLEVSFAVTSLLVIGLMVIFTWFLGSSQLVINIK